MSVRVGSLVDIVEYDYPAFHITMHCFLCELAAEGGHIQLTDHDTAKWLSSTDLDSACWLPADQGVVQKLKEADRVWEVRA